MNSIKLDKIEDAIDAIKKGEILTEDKLICLNLYQTIRS